MHQNINFCATLLILITLLIAINCVKLISQMGGKYILDVVFGNCTRKFRILKIEFNRISGEMKRLRYIYWEWRMRICQNFKSDVLRVESYAYHGDLWLVYSETKS